MFGVEGARRCHNPLDVRVEINAEVHSFSVVVAVDDFEQSGVPATVDMQDIELFYVALQGRLGLIVLEVTAVEFSGHGFEQIQKIVAKGATDPLR